MANAQGDGRCVVMVRYVSLTAPYCHGTAKVVLYSRVGWVDLTLAIDAIQRLTKTHFLRCVVLLQVS